MEVELNKGKILLIDEDDFINLFGDNDYGKWYAKECRGGQWFLTEQEAKLKAEQLRLSYISRLEKRLIKLKTMNAF